MQLPREKEPVAVPQPRKLIDHNRLQQTADDGVRRVVFDHESDEEIDIVDRSVQETQVGGEGRIACEFGEVRQ